MFRVQLGEGSSFFSYLDRITSYQVFPACPRTVHFNIVNVKDKTVDAVNKDNGKPAAVIHEAN